MTLTQHPRLPPLAPSPPLAPHPPEDTLHTPEVRPPPQQHPTSGLSRRSLPRPCAHDRGPIPDLEGAPGRPGAPGSRASWAGSHRRPSPSGSRAAGGAEGLGRSLVLLLPQWPWPCPPRTPGSEEKRQQPPGARSVAPPPPGTSAMAQREAGAPPRDNAPAPDWPAAGPWEPIQVSGWRGGASSGDPAGLCGPGG